jgi:antitoxin Phd
MSVIKFPGPSGHAEDIEAVSATAVKNTLADVLDLVVDRGIVAITRHDKPRIVMLSIPQYEALVKRAGDPLEHMHGYFEDMVTRMQGPQTTDAIDELFAMPKKRSRARKPSTSK